MKIRYCAALVFLVTQGFLPSSLQAQITIEWAPRTDVNTNWPSSLRLFEGTSTQPALKLWYIEADLADTTWEIRGVLSEASSGRETTVSFASRTNAFAAINGGYFDLTSGASYSLVVDRGQVRSTNIASVTRTSGTYFPTRSAFGINTANQPDVAWIYTVAGVQYAYPNPSPNTTTTPQPRPSATFPEGGAPWEVYNAMGGGPVLVHDGVIRVTYDEEVFFGSGISGETTQPRTAIGYTQDNRVIMLVVDGRQPASQGVTMAQLARIMLDLGSVEAMNLDGGGSTTMVAAAQLINRPEGGTFQRPVASALVIVPREQPPVEPPSLIFDNGDACCYREIGGWQSSANTPYWGTTPSRITVVGDGSTKAVFTLDAEMEAAAYEVSAWWTPSFNRATNTPFTVYSRGEATTVRVNQTPAATSGQWNVLGRFNLERGDSIVVSNDATGTASPAYVSVDAVRLVLTGPTSAERRQSGFSGDVILYPNPASHHVDFKVATGGPLSITLFDMLGREVLSSGRLSSPAGRLDLTSVARGVYLARIMTQEGTTSRLLVRQ
jgi:hypothetical protein